jgi:HlyD family secretion protein
VVDSPALPDVVVAEGQVVAYEGAEVVVGTEVSGLIIRLTVKEKSAVGAGDVIAESSSADLRASRAEAMARVAEAEADIRFYEREDRRERALLARNATTPQNFDANFRGLELARARRSAAVACCDRFDALIAKTRITAPIDGVVTVRHAHPGEIVRPGTALVTIADLKRLRIEAEVDEFDIARVALGSLVTIKAEGYGTIKWRGTVEEIPDSVVSRRTRPTDPGRPIDARVLPIKIAFAEQSPLKLGQRVDVEIAPPNTVAP